MFFQILPGYPAKQLHVHCSLTVFTINRTLGIKHFKQPKLLYLKMEVVSLRSGIGT
jgi:hypothetical protein